MSDLDHRPGVKEENLVVRHLNLQGLDGVDRAEMLEAIDQTFGVESVSFDGASGRLTVAYDATHCCIDAIEALIHRQGVEISHDWWSRFKEGYYRFVDQNVKDNAGQKPWSCHNKS